MTVAAPAPAGVWNHPVLRGVLIAEFVSVLGSALSIVAVPWLVLTETGSARSMGLVMAAQMAGTALLGSLSASWAGRAGPRRVMLLGDACRGLLIALVPLLTTCGSYAVPLIAVATFVMGGWMAPYSASQQAMVPEVVGEDEALLSRANAALQGSMRAGLLLGPPLGGLLVGLLGAAPVVILDAASFAVSLVLLRRYLPTTRPDLPATSSRSARGGLRTLLSDPLTACWSLALTFSEFAWQGLFAAIPVVALRYGDHGATLSGVLSGAFGGAALTGTLLVGPLLRRLPAPALAVSGRILLALSFFALLLPLGATAVLCCLVAAGLLNGVSSAPVAAVRALRLPAASRSQALTVATAVALGGGTCGLLAGSTVIQASGVHTVFLLLCLAQTTAAVLHVGGLLAVRRRAPVADPAQT
ncbi:MFS transporter [Streptomyces sp. NPDC058954]|uniref:MFS transporter n=1 Tax=Streptomyces sp. NPDC058954 TaxID=3346677 RepID=UPI0036CF9180